MSYAEPPELNPYAAPVSEIVDQDIGQPTSGYTGYAGFWRRFAALFIDNIIVSVAQVAIGAVFGAVVGVAGDDPSVRIALGVFMYILLLGGAVAYFAGMESSSSQATLGKMAMGIRVTDLYGRRISFGKAVGRTFGKIISAMILYIGFLMAAFTEKKQGLHDIMAGTLVLKTR